MTFSSGYSVEIQVRPSKWRRILKITQNLPCTYVLTCFRVMSSGHPSKISIQILYCKSDDEIWVSCSPIYVTVDFNLFTISILFYFRLLAYDCLSLGISFDHLSRERRLYAEISLRTALLFSRSERSIWGQILAKWRVLIGGNCRKRFSAYRRPLL